MGFDKKNSDIPETRTDDPRKGSITGDPQEEPITEDPKEDPITEKPKKNIFLRTPRGFRNLNDFCAAKSLFLAFW